MTDVTQGQDAPDATSTEKPDVDTLFGAKDVDDLFPSNYKAPDPINRNASPLHDYIFSSPLHAPSRVLDAFGYGFSQDWGAGSKSLSEADEYLRKAGVYNDYAKGQRNIIKAANEAIMRPAVSAILAAKSAMGGVMHGAQEAVVKAGEEVGAPNLAREVAAIPEAFPAGFHQATGIPRFGEMPHSITQAKELNVIGAGEGGYFGTKPVEAEAPNVAAHDAKVEGAAHTETLPGHDSEATPSPVVQQPPAQPEAAPDIHAVARQIAPDTFHEFDALAQKKDTFRRWIGELREVRDQDAATNAPHQAEISDLQGKLEGATPRLAKKYNERLEPLIAERDAYIADKTRADSADMARVRQQLMETDYRMRDLAPDVSKAYRDAEARAPQAEEVSHVEPETPQAVEQEPAQSAQVPEAATVPAGTTAANAAAAAEPTRQGELLPKPEAPAAVAETKPENVTTSPRDVTAQLPIAHAPSIVADVSQKLKAAGRPAEEADAAGQIVAAYWETRAQRFEGAKGTAAEMYARETPDIVAGKEKPSKVKKARELELAQDRTTETPEFKSWFKDSHVTDDSGFPLVVYHGSNRRFSEFKPTEGFRQDEYGNKHAVTSNAFFFAPDKDTARVYANNQVGVDKNLRGGPGGRANVQPYYLSVQQPLDFVITPEAWKYIQEEGEFFVRPNEPNPYTAGDIERITGYAPQTWREVQQALDDPRVIQELKKDGFDGVRLAEQDGSEAWAVFDPTQVKSTTKNTGEFNPKNPNVYHQGIQGRIRVRDEGRNTITLMKTADASTFIHETGHDWLDRMLKDSTDDHAPEVLKNDAQSVLKWLGADSAEGIKTSHHEKFARGFETYIMEGRAPSSALARVFAKFKDWLTTIYRTVKALKSPISDDIRGVFDRLLAEKPEKTVIAPERETAGGLAEKHEALAEATPAHEGFKTAGEIRSERDSQALPNQVERNDARLSNAREGTEEHAPGGAESSSDADASGSERGTTEASVGYGAVGEGGSEAAGEGARARKESAAEQLGPTDDLPKPDTQLVDKAGNIKLGNLNTPDDVKAVIRATARDNNDFLAERRNVISDSTALKLAEALGMDPAMLSMRKLGEAFNEEQIIAAADLLIKSAAEVRDLSAKLAGGTEADVLAFAQANQRHLMIQGQFSGAAAEAGRALHAFQVLKKLQGLQGAKELGGTMQDLTGKTLYQIKEQGILLSQMGTAQQVSKAIHDAGLTRYQKVRAGTLSYFINNLISGPITHAGYTVGNTVTQVFKATVDTSVAAAYGAFRDLPPGERVYFGEVGAQLYGMVRGMRDGYTPAVTALKTGVPYMKGDVAGMIGQIEAAHRPQAIPGQVGYALETPSRAVTAIHTMHYSMNYEAEIARRAFRSAMKDELEPGTPAFNTKIADFTQSPPAAEMEAAHNEALKMVLMKSAQFGSAQYHLQRAVNSNILAKIVMPFMQVGANILHESFIERTPLGFMSQNVRDNLMGKNGEVAKHTQASRIAVGIGISTAVIGLTSEGILTGGGPSDHKQLAIKEMTGWRPYSIKVGDTYVPYRKYLGGMGPLIAGTADIYEVGHTLSEEGLTKAAAASLFGFAEVIADESWAKGLSNFIDAARHWDRDGSRYLRNLAADFIPFSIGLQQLSTVADPYRREVRTMLDSARAHIPGLSRGLFPVRDIWGEPIESHTALGPSHTNNDPATQALLDAQEYPAKLERKIRGVDLTDQQYDDYARLAGRMARMRVSALVNTPGFAQMPQPIRKQKLQDIVSGARESARSMIMMQSMNSDNNIVTKANDAKLAKIKGDPAKAATVH